MSMAVASIGMQVGGAYLSAQGAKNKAAAQQATLGYEAAVAANNQKIAQYQSGLAIQNGQIMAENQQLKTNQVMGDQRAAMAANGVDLGTGSSADVLATTKFMGERDSLTIQDNAARQAWGYQLQAQNYGNEANTDNAMKNAINPDLAMETSLLGSASSVASSWYQYNKSGAK